VEEGRVSVTPIHLDLTARGLLRRLRDWDLELP
jgi:broad specificity polyphosphatase/5'/3'-nucleotidase SurE